MWEVAEPKKGDIILEEDSVQGSENVGTCDCGILYTYGLEKQDASLNGQIVPSRRRLWWHGQSRLSVKEKQKT